MVHEIIHVAAENGNQQFQVLDQITRNIANFNTTGYKAQRFEQYLAPGGQVQGIVRTDTTQGAPIITRRELDVAIEGQGYLPVTQPDGLVAYTRDGSMTVGPDGMLYTKRGDLVGEGIKLPLEYNGIKIYEDGTIEATFPPGKPPQKLGKLSLVVFQNPEGLESIGGNKLVATETSGGPQWMNEPTFLQGKLERANVNIPSQIDSVLRLNAGLISNYRMIKFADDLYRQAVNLRQ